MFNGDFSELGTTIYDPLTKQPFLLALTGHPPAANAARRVAADRRGQLGQLPHTRA